jgi:DNA ligase-1
VAEWKWDGIRVQIVNAGGDTGSIREAAMRSRQSFPEIAGALNIPAVLDGELLVRGTAQGGEARGAGSFNALQQRLGRKAVSKAMLTEAPAFVRLYDFSFWTG